MGYAVFQCNNQCKFKFKFCIDCANQMKLFSYWCFAAAAVFSIISLRGMMLEDFGVIVIIPSLLCIALVIVGMKHMNKKAGS